MRKIDTAIKLKIDSEELDNAIEKAERLVELLNEAQQILIQLHVKKQSEA